MQAGERASHCAVLVPGRGDPGTVCGEGRRRRSGKTIMERGARQPESPAKLCRRCTQELGAVQPRRHVYTHCLPFPPSLSLFLSPSFSHTPSLALLDTHTEQQMQGNVGSLMLIRISLSRSASSHDKSVAYPSVLHCLPLPPI